MNVELLAPGGSYDSTIAALNAGADAVYTGGEMFGARAGADNLTEEQLIDVIHYAHIHDKKVYLTVNTLLKDEEISQRLYDYILPLYENGLDAVIVQDIGVIEFFRKQFPKLHIHASTQMTVFGKATAMELKKMGITRIVMPRELSLDEIRDIYDNTGIEIESFVHGALCYCYSGQCFLSSYIGGRSGNRGRCAQPCRMEYDIIKDNEVLNRGNQKYVLSPKDICTLDILPQIISSGVYSLKIEGRMKKLEYIAGVVSIYRKYIDLYYDSLQKNTAYKVDEYDKKLLHDLFNRNGFHESYYLKHNGREMISLCKPKFRIENEEYNSYLREKYSGKRLKKEIDINVSCKKNQPFKISAYLDGKYIEAGGEVPATALKRPMDANSIKKQICKTGNTDFSFHNVKIELDEGLFIPVGEMNNIRRKFIDKIYDEILSSYQRDKVESENYFKIKENDISGISVHVSVSTMEQLNEVVKKDFIDTIYIETQDFSKTDLHSGIQKIYNVSKKCIIALPFVFRKDNIEYFEKNYMGLIRQLSDKIDGVLIRNIEQYFYFKKKDIVNSYIFDYNVYTYNQNAKAFYRSFGDVKTTVPVELNYKELRLRGCGDEEMIVYGYMPVMISAGCGLKTTNHCIGKNSIYQLRDRKNNIFQTKCICKYCYNIMYNSNPLSLFKFHSEIQGLNVSSVRISLTFENRETTNQILTKAESAFVHKKLVYEDDKSTRGHFNRGVL